MSGSATLIEKISLKHRNGEIQHAQIKAVIAGRDRTVNAAFRHPSYKLVSAFYYNADDRTQRLRGRILETFQAELIAHMQSGTVEEPAPPKPPPIGAPDSHAVLRQLSDKLKSLALSESIPAEARIEMNRIATEMDAEIKKI